MKIKKSLTLLASLSMLTFSQAYADEAFDKSMNEFLSKDENVEKIGNALERYFQKKREEQVKAQAKAEEKLLEDQFNNPVKIALGASPVIGNKNAKITIVEFSDFQCPFCARGKQTVDDILKEYPNDVKVVFKNLPLPMHPEAGPAAVAALAAGEQGKFWEMHDKLFDNQRALGSEKYIELAKELGLDMAKFKADLKNERLKKMVEDDAALAAELGIRGTPGFFVNGVQVKGARPLPYFKNIIDKWLERLK